MTRIGAIFSPYPNPPESFRDAVFAAEDAGLAELWLWEDCFRQSGFAPAAAALAWTERLHVGIGISPMPLRNAAVTAMEIATIARTFPGRFLPGLGHGVQSWMAQAGVKVASPLTLMREYVPSVRSLLRGESVSLDGRYVHLDDVQLAWPPPVSARVYAAAEGPKTLALAGEVADGVVLDSRRSPDELAKQIERVRAGAGPAPRDVVAFVVAAFGEGALERVTADFATNAPDRSAESRALAGSVDDVARGIEAFAAAGVDSVVLLPPAGEPDLAAFYRQAGAVARSIA
ncbi:LLM class flavin-dependent oxidoreductase [Microbacterium aoyamense]|uniref:LLM class flavin-dependent oxidoreductase n=1 Tax=Microbacterium aoyamense TaxID=344166 RepID=A0ABN2Q3G6_9MICO|nr:LLM class flavin-dependent oxidoreductase [Microbacterium aoyamense]